MLQVQDSIINTYHENSAFLATKCNENIFSEFTAQIFVHIVC